jgi:hypothetical protein
LSQGSSERVKRPDTVLRTFRIPKNINDVLELEAMSRGISPNALLSSILIGFTNWDRLAERFGYISVTHELFKDMIEAVPEERIMEIAQTDDARITQEAMMFWSKEISVSSFLAYLEFHCKYAGYGQFEYNREDGSNTVTVAIHHHLGRTWSNFLKSSLDKVLNETLGVVGKFEVAENTVMFKFKPP